MISRRMIAGLLMAATGGSARAAGPVTVLSGGALEPVLGAALEQWRVAGGEAPVVTFATAPRIAARLAAGETPDLVLAPRAMIEALQAAGRLKAAPLPLGAIGVGIAVRGDAPDPGIHDEASLRAARPGRGGRL